MNGPTLDVETIRGWSNVALELNALDHCLDPPNRAAAPGPCASSYALGLVHAALADACTYVVDAGYKPVVGKKKPSSKPADADRFAGGAAYGFLEHVFQQPEHFELLKKALAALPNGGKDWDLGVEFAKQVNEIWDGGKIIDRVKPDQPFYVPKSGKHNVDPLNDDQGFYGQAWAGQTKSVKNLGKLASPVAPLGLVQSDLDAAFKPLKNPPSETSQRFLDSGRQVKVLGKLPTNPDEGPTGLQLTVGTFFAYDGAANIGTPPRLYVQLLNQVLDARGDSLSAAALARLLALFNLAMANASIVAWRGKYEHAIQRPIQWIREAPTDIQDKYWQPLGSPRSTRESPYCTPKMSALGAQAFIAGTRDKQKFTPNFPAYPSGHATFAGACFEVLKAYLGSSYLLKDKKYVTLKSDELKSDTKDPFTKKGRPQKEEPFRLTDDLMDAAAYSRIVLGVHWDFDGIDGVAAGRIVGKQTAQKLYKLG